MIDTAESEALSGKLLVAMPGMGDTRFEGSVVFLCEHGPKGSMGLIINKPSYELEFGELLDQLSIESDPSVTAPKVQFGGPVEMGRGFVLHSPDYDDETTMHVDGRFGMTATIDALEDLAQGTGPAKSILALGYAGWAPGQLYGEIAQNGWLICDATEELVFDLANEAKWTGALKSLGVDPMLLSSTAGHA